MHFGREFRERMSTLISTRQFTQQFPRLILTASEIPRKPLPFNLLLISAAIRFQPNQAYSEQQVNERLQGWILELGAQLGMDYSTLRRFLVDEGYLARDAAGSAYVANERGRRFSFEPSLRKVDLVELVDTEREVRAERKKRYSGGR